MAMDPRDQIFRLAKQRIVKLSGDLEAHLAAAPGGGIVVEILRRLQERAAESMAALVTTDFTNVKQMLVLQNEVKRYDEWFGCMRDILAEGKMYDQEFTEDDRREMLDMLVLQSEEGHRQAIALGLIEPPLDE